MARTVATHDLYNNPQWGQHATCTVSHMLCSAVQKSIRDLYIHVEMYMVIVNELIEVSLNKF